MIYLPHRTTLLCLHNRVCFWTSCSRYKASDPANQHQKDNSSPWHALPSTVSGSESRRQYVGFSMGYICGRGEALWIAVGYYMVGFTDTSSDMSGDLVGEVPSKYVPSRDKSIWVDIQLQLPASWDIRGYWCRRWAADAEIGGYVETKIVLYYGIFIWEIAVKWNSGIPIPGRYCCCIMG